MRDRLYRGYCVAPDEYPEGRSRSSTRRRTRSTRCITIQIGKLLQPDIVKETLEYFDDFYKTINDPRALKRNIIEACLGKHEVTDRRNELTRCR